MTMPEFLCPTVESLSIPASVLLSQWPQGGLFLLSGEMGAGKTTFVREVCRQSGAAGAVSPTFSLINIYTTADGRKVIHMDLYRLERLEEALDLGIEEYLDHPGYVFIEWPGLVESIAGENAIPVRIESDGINRTVILP